MTTLRCGSEQSSQAYEGDSGEHHVVGIRSLFWRSSKTFLVREGKALHFTVIYRIWYSLPQEFGADETAVFAAYGRLSRREERACEHC